MMSVSSSTSPLIADLSEFLVGSWSRTLHHQGFGENFPSIRSSHTVIKIENYSSAHPEPRTKFLKWSFGKSQAEEEMKFGFVMKLISGEKASEADETRIEWQFNGAPCSGVYQPVTAALILNFHLGSLTAVNSFRILNENSIAVAIVEIPETSDRERQPTVQLGNMKRIEKNNSTNENSKENLRTENSSMKL